MRKLQAILIIAICTFVLSGTQVHATLLSTFNTGTEGWGTADYAGTYPVAPLLWSNSGGNPDGYVYAEWDELTGGFTLITAPNGWMGDWTSYIGGTLGYDINVLSMWSGGVYQTAPDVIIADSNNNKLVWRSGIVPSPNTWIHYEVELSQNNFQIYGTKTFEEIMSNVNFLAIRGEFFTGPDMVGLDNVNVTPVPEPATILLLSSGLIGLAGFRRKFKK